MFGISDGSAMPVSNIAGWLHERELMQHLIQQHLNRAQKRMKNQTDKSRLERSFQIGDMFFLMLQPYVQTSLAPRSN